MENSRESKEPIKEICVDKLEEAFPQIEVWGGAEYTYNRVRDHYLDQMEFSGHALRLDDYDKFHELGIRTLRVGLLWEHHEKYSSWRWADERLSRLRQLGIRPIVGLLHHGSGPPHTGLLDPQFAEKLAAYAGSFAARYPSINAYTPVNEPNTTARFSGLYGKWYPHQTSRLSYLQALLNQLKGTVLSMAAIRRVQSDAKLIQTEDVGRISGTEVLRPTWEMLNLRQWLPFDLLCGKVDRDHPMFGYMLEAGISDREILWFMDHPCPPDIVGINYYLTSDRYLDHRVSLYPPDRGSIEGNFVDVEAVRVRPCGMAGIDSLLLEAWGRYRIPVAIAEVHLGGPVEDQIRWVAEAWEGIRHAQHQGAQCIALTIWALLGSYYWNNLVTSENGHYETGAFDVSGGRPITTELAIIISQIASGHSPLHRTLSVRGWWRDEGRSCFPFPLDSRNKAA